jgi:hypothetical protein
MAEKIMAEIIKSCPVDSSSKFDDLRPYRDAEINAAMRRIAADKKIPGIMHYVFGKERGAKKMADLHNFKSVRDFQANVMDAAINNIAKKTIDGFTCDGLEKLDKNKGYLFISNHRDILLDAALLQIALYSNGFDTSEITFGNNLMQPGLVTDIGKSNKMFKVIRSGNAKDFYRCSMHLSDYIRYTLTQRHQSVWIAQRNGRTKNGDDKTSQTILKMFSLSGGKILSKNLSELNIVPMSISYQWETCDKMKVRELFLSQNHPYIKEPGEDMRSIVTGIMQPKGKVHIQICKPIATDELEQLDNYDRNDALSLLAHIIDRRIYDGYKLWNTNYIAYDMLYNTFKFADRYTQEEYRNFSERMHKTLEQWPDELLPLMDLYLQIYSNPVVNKLSQI